MDPGRNNWAEQITTAWCAGIGAIFEIGRLLISAKADLKHGQFERMIENELPFGPRTAQMLIKIAGDERLTNPIHGSLLPLSWRTLYELSQLGDDELADRFNDGSIRPELERSEILAWKRQEKHHPHHPSGGLVSDLKKFAMAGYRVGTVYADPPWLYDNQATRAATSNHYEGLTVDELCALPVRDFVADDAHLHLWTTNGFLFECPRIFAAWGFEFRSSFVWVKPEIGIGNYWRNAHEILLTAVRGNARAFANHNLKSWLECSRGRHSSKPEQVRTFIESASPGPRIELFAVRCEAPGWFFWGRSITHSLLSRYGKEVAHS